VSLAIGKRFCISALGLLSALAGLGLTAAPVKAQFFDPPLGWDMWDPTWPEREVWEGESRDETLRWRMDRHQTYIENGVPEAYRDARNPLPRIPTVVEDGHALYEEHCASCHDPKGQGRGEAGLSLLPSPALLAHLVRLPSRVDEYLFWTVAEGGRPFATDMPAFKDKLGEEQIWRIITYMRAGFPTADGEGQR
jgi:mono/diheme cytochrome c family protein